MDDDEILRSRSYCNEDADDATNDDVDGVEVIASIDPSDGSIRSMRMLPHSFSSSKEYLPSLVDEGTPALMRLEAEEESDSSSEEEEEAGHNTTFKSQQLSEPIPLPHDTPTGSHSLIRLEDAGTVGPYDCLSDEFTNLFCAVAMCDRQPPASPEQSPSKSLAATPSIASAVGQPLDCMDISCSAYDSYDWIAPHHGDGLFQAMPFWGSSSRSRRGRGQEFSLQVPQHPHNRGPKQRARHVHRLYKTWHTVGGEEIPLVERSVSLPGSNQDMENCYSHVNVNSATAEGNLGYDSDPEQDHPHCQKRRKRDLLRNQRGSFRDHRPAPIDTSMGFSPQKSIAKASKLLHPFGAPPPPPPPSAPRHRDRASFDFSAGSNQATPVTASPVLPARPRQSHRLPTSATAASTTARNPSPKELMSHREEGDISLRTFIHETTNTKIPLTWHRKATTSSSLNDATTCSPMPVVPLPMAVMGTFEVGAHLDSVVVQPKFTWTPTHEPFLKDSRRLSLSQKQPHGMELLSIIRVTAAAPTTTHLNRQDYPYCRLDRTIVITTNEEPTLDKDDSDFDMDEGENNAMYVLEANSREERDWLVNALKLIVARLASIIIVRDEAMLLEFFTPFAGMMLHEELLVQEEEEEEEAAAALLLRDEMEDCSARSTFSRTGKVQLVSPVIQPSMGANGQVQFVSYATGR